MDGAEVAALLGVERSFGGRRWRAMPSDERIAAALVQRLGLPEPVARVLAGRGIALEAAEAYLEPRLRDALTDPFLLRGMDVAATRLARAVLDGETVGLFGDYDVDGATGTALLTRFFQALGTPTLLHIPDRLTEGYGPNTPAMLALGERGAKVIVTVDCGTLAFEPLAEAARAGIEVVVCDHHEAELELPVALAVVNPNRLDETDAPRQLCAVGVAFLLCVAISRKLREAGRQPPDLMRWLDIVALGTVCDVVPLTGLNRAFVAQGLKVMAGRQNIGLAALADVAGLTEPPDAWHLGYMMGPRVNAGGRVGSSDLGSRLLTTDDPLEARRIAQQLDEYNRERQAIEVGMLEEAIAQVEAGKVAGEPFVIAAGEGWHAGVVGIIASRLKDRYDRPALAISLNGDRGVGSGRSLPGMDLGAAIIAARQAGLLVKGGGHAMAAGFTVERERMEDFRRFLADRLGKLGETQPSYNLDGVVQVAGATLALVQSLRRLGPFGSGNPEPRFAVLSARPQAARVVGSGHVSCQLAGEGGGRLRAIAFRSADTPLGQALLRSDGTPLHLAGTLRLDKWQGEERVQLFIEDAAPAI